MFPVCKKTTKPIPVSELTPTKSTKKADGAPSPVTPAKKKRGNSVVGFASSKRRRVYSKAYHGAESMLKRAGVKKVTDVCTEAARDAVDKYLATLKK